MKAVTLSLLAAALLCGCHKKELVYQIDEAIQANLTNDVVGYSRTVKVHMSRFEGGPTNWQAIATVEFVNKNGGIERTNLPYRFVVSDDGLRLFALLDEEQIALEDRKAFERQMAK